MAESAIALSLRAVALVALALSVVGCAGAPKSGQCPSAVILASTASLTALRKGAENDPAGEIYTATMTNLKSNCDFDKDASTTSSNVAISFRAVRTPSGVAAQYSVPYFLAVTAGGDHIISKRMFVAQFSFAPGAATSDFTDGVDATVIKLEHGKRGSDYQILVGFQLTQAQLDYNRKMGRYAP